VKEFSTDVDDQIDYSIILPRMISAEINTSTKLDQFRILIAIAVTDHYLMQHTAVPELEHLTTNRNGGLANPLAKARWHKPVFRRIHGTFAEDAAKYTNTTAMMDWNFRKEHLEELDKDAFVLGGFVDQPTLKALPLYAQFVDRVATLSVPEGDAAKTAQARSDKAAKQWATVEPLPCSAEPPDLPELVLELDVSYD
jgi:hypothetical protein